MERKKLFMEGVVVCLTLMLVMITGCSAPAPAPTPTPTLTLTPTPAPTPAPTVWKPPELIRWATGWTGSVQYVSGTALLSGISDVSGVKFRLLPGEKTIDRLLFLRSKAVHFTYGTAADAYFALNGLGEFNDKEWGRQSVRIVWVCGGVEQGFMVRGDSGIKTPADLKGKKVPQYPGYPEIDMYIDGLLAFANLTRKDVVQVPVGGFAQGMTAVVEGATDVSPAPTTVASAYNLAASTHGLRWLPLPATDTKAWARLREAIFFFYPALATEGAGGITKEKPAEIYNFTNLVFAYDWQDENLAYWMTKQIHMSYDKYKDKHVYLKTWTIEQALKTAVWFAPWHAGSIRYFKEIGKWTNENERVQKELLAKYPQTMTR